jgi:hypothetical protein
LLYFLGIAGFSARRHCASVSGFGKLQRNGHKTR